MNCITYQYIELLKEASTVPLCTGRNGDFSSVFGKSLTIDLSNGFQMIKARQLNLPLIVTELKWFLSGNTDIPDSLQNIWKPFVHESNPNQIYSYGYAIRTQGADVDQWYEAIQGLAIDNNNRRIVIDLHQNWYNPVPCHVSICLSRRHGRLYMSVLQRSADIILGLPWDITQYSILLMLIAKVLDLKPGTLNWFIHDAHVYSNHDMIGWKLTDIYNTTNYPYVNDISNQEINFTKFQQSPTELVHCPENFEVEFPNYKPLTNVKVPYNV